MLDALNNWRLTRKMLVAFALIALVIVSLGTAAAVSNRTIYAAERVHATRSLPATLSLSRILAYIREYRILMYAHMIANQPDEIAKLDQRIRDNHDNLGKGLAELAGVVDPAFGPAVARLKADVARLEEVDERIIELSRQHRQTEILAMLKGDGREASHAALTTADTLMRNCIENSQAEGLRAETFAERTFALTMVLALFAVGFLIFVWNSLNRSVARPMMELATATTTLANGRETGVPHRDRADEVGEIAQAVELFRLAATARQEADHAIANERELVTSALSESLAALAQGDLTTEVKAEFPATAHAIKVDFNRTVAHLREMIGAVSQSAAGIRTGSGEIAQAAEDLARRTESNAASLEETSAALSQIDDRLKATAKAASRTVERADKAIATVGGGRSIADEAVQAMERVRASATGIDSVIEGLDKIAFQTRVLAMNAAVEAGRAGDAGRGFAVVADLVSSLAMRAEEEAKRARDQLTVTQTDIVTAVGAVQRVDGALADISDDVSEVHGLLGSMATDNQAQSAAITQISAAIGSMDQSTQQNAAMVEQTSAAARNLTSEVMSLAEQAALFRVESGSRPVTAKAEKVSTIKLATARPYVSPVQPLPVAAMADAGHMNGAGNEDWSDF